ncbi:hypothetical protein N7495_009056 [Penicillium taxi]|uniref:uncharacterized protein n=1 Tax=Penicillium taxi TaxID=168475 RepID=UPI0025456EAD|nr:uncharacterized protein N7495_009056 [Penicillium taxi]KAJ5889015.1 hypothetical protein N7495_009056 [Penicillium taxi]
MLAVRRSVRESHFDFQSYDTALFYGFQYSDGPFLSPQDLRWKGLTKAQSHYVTEEQNQFDNPSKDCMMLLMADYGVNNEIEGIFQQARTDFLDHFLCNGLCRSFPSEYDAPIDSPSRDYFLHAFFEAQYVLWILFFKSKPGKADLDNSTKPSPEDLNPVVEFNPDLDKNIIFEPSEEWLYNYPGFLDQKPDIDHVWQQRRVLEGLIFSKIVTVINQSTSIIHAEVVSQLGQKDMKNITSEGIFESNEIWSSMNEAIETLKEDLRQISKHIEDWKVREELLKNERPRWTRNNKYRFRDIINRVHLLQDVVERNFKATEADIRKVSQILKLRQETQKAKYDQKMTDLSFRQNNHVALFTYSTVFFLPLGFATSFFSMQAAPSFYLMRQMKKDVEEL